MIRNNNNLPPSLVANLQNVLTGRKAAAGGGGEGEAGAAEEEPAQAAAAAPAEAAAGEAGSGGAGEKGPVVLVTNGDGIGSPGLRLLVEGLVKGGQCDVHVCAPESDKSVSGHSVTLGETLAVSSTEINGATAFEVSGTPVDCVSLALSGALFSWSRPTLVISGINKRSSSGNHIFYSGAVAGAREAILCGVPSLSISLNWKKEESQESDFRDAVDVCLPLIHAAIRDIEKGIFPKSCLLSIEIPTSPSTNKGFRLTKQSLRGPALTWQTVSTNRHASAGQFMSMQQSLGIQLAQLSRDASAAGAARRITTQRKNVEIESIAAEGKPEAQQTVKKYFRLEFSEKEPDNLDDDLDFRAVESGFIAVTPLHFHPHVQPETQASASDWLASALTGCEEAP